MNDTPDLSALLSMLSSKDGNQNINPQELLANLMNSSSNNASNDTSLNNSTNKQDFYNDYSDSTTKNSNDTSNMPDMEMMMKLMKIVKTSNEDSPSKELLKSLKPFLNDDRKEKVDQYIKILGMTKAFEIFNELGDKPK